MRNHPAAGDHGDRPEEPPDPPGTGGPVDPPLPPRASRSTTVALLIGLFVVVIVTGAVGTIAVLMTRQPDRPLGAPPPTRLATTIHFAPVTGVRAAPCPGAEAVLDDKGTTCYQVAPGVTVTSVVKVEALADKNGGYSVRVVPAPESRGRLADLTHDALNQQLAIVVDDKVVTAPRVAQALTQDSLSIAGLTKEAADTLVSRLLGTGGAPPATASPGASATPGGGPSTCPPGSTAGADPTATDGGAGTAGTSGTTGTGAPGGPMTGGAGSASASPGTPGGPATCPPGTGTSAGTPRGTSSGGGATGAPTTTTPATGTAGGR